MVGSSSTSKKAYHPLSFRTHASERPLIGESDGPVSAPRESIDDEPLRAIRESRDSVADELFENRVALAPAAVGLVEHAPPPSRF